MENVCRRSDLPDFHIVIPARYASQRFPQKLLADLGGKPVLQWAHELALKAGAKSVTIATDHFAIEEVAKGFGASVVMTKDDHENGTERLAEVADKMGWTEDEIIVNVQGDEPFLPVTLIHSAVAELEADVESELSTVACSITSEKDFFNSNVVKVICDNQHRALYFSRSPIPWDRDGFAKKELGGDMPLKADFPAYRHVGLYVYRASLLAKYAGLAKSPLEIWEKLEQLRFLHQGIKVKVALVDQLPPHGVDTLQDLEELRKLLGTLQL